jgi:hypothetical protein
MVVIVLVDHLQAGVVVLDEGIVVYAHTVLLAGRSYTRTRGE